MDRASTVLSALLATLTTADMALAGDHYPQFVEQGYRIDYMVGIGTSGLVSLDIDGDSAQEVVFSALAGGEQFIAALDAQADGSFRITHERIVFPDDLFRILGRMEGSQPRIITLGRNGIVREYGGVPFFELRRFQTQPQAVAAALGDVDGDGQQELVVLTPTTVLAYALTDGHLVRSHAAAGFTELVLAQLDADPALEVVLTGENVGRVLDGATAAIEWEQPGGFGRWLTAGRFGPGGTTSWAGATWSGATVYRPWAAVWTIPSLEGIRRIASAADGPTADVLVVDEYGSALSVYDTNQQLRFRFVNDGLETSSIVGADVDGNGRNAIVFASSKSWLSIRSMGVLDGDTGQLLDEVFTDKGPYLKTVIGDFDGDGRQEIAATASPYESRFELALFDLATGLPKWTSTYSWPPTQPLSSPIADLVTVPKGKGSDLALLDRRGNLRFIDGTTLEQTWWVPSPPGVAGEALALIDYDQDGTQDFVVGNRIGISAGVQLRVLSGRDGALLWQSVVMGGMFTSANQVVVADASAHGGRRQLIAVLNDGVRAYDADTGLLDWILDAGGATVSHVNEGVTGPELVVTTPDGQLQFYDAGHAGAEPVLLRQFTLATPLRTLTALDDDVRLLLATTRNGPLLIDGGTGEIRASSLPISAFSTSSAAPPSVFRQSPNTWQIAVGTEVGMYRYRLVMEETIFADGLDGT